MEEYTREQCKQALFQLAELVAGLDRVRLEVDEERWLTMMRNALSIGESINHLFAAAEEEL